MSHYHILKHTKKPVIVATVSLVAIIFLVMTVDWQDTIRIFRSGVSMKYLLPFSLMALAITLICGYRWRLLLDQKLQHKTSQIASILCLGGNMFFPARGGDLLKVHYSHVVTTMPHTEVLSRLFIEKVIDLVTIIAVGVFSIIFFIEPTGTKSFYILVSFIITVLTAITATVITLKYFNEALLQLLHHPFKFVGKTIFFERYVAPMIQDAGRSLTIPIMLLPSILTLIMWLSVFTMSYVLAAEFVGVTLNYKESLVVLFAGAIGLMLPAAPSGVGTFHASVVSAFIFMNRSPAEGLLVATAIHLLFFVAYVVPATIFYSRWRHSQNLPSEHQ